MNISENEVLIQQINGWNETEEYQRIVDAIKELPEEKQTPNLISELARAYNNLAVLKSGEAFDKDLLYKAIDLLKSVEEDLKDDHCWNYRLAFAYYYLYDEGRALPYFERALEARPGDGDTKEYIDSCREILAFPRFEKSFRQRTEEGWASFLAGEAKLRQIMDEKQDRGRIIALCDELLSPAFTDICFELANNEEKYELILTPEGNKAKLFQIYYFSRHVPEEVLEHWNILVGRQPSGEPDSFAIQMFGFDISGKDIVVYPEPKNGMVVLFLYCGKMVPLLEEDEDKAYWLIMVMLDHIIGEIAAMRYIRGLELVSVPLDGESLTFEHLPEYLNKTFAEQNGDIMDVPGYCESYTCYELKPGKDEENKIRKDVYAGITACVPLLNEYLYNKSDIMNNFHLDGIVAGFFYYPLDGFKGENIGKQVIDFREYIEAEILKRAGADAVTFIGGASGVSCGYLDFIAWDLRAVLIAAADVFRETSLKWAEFQTFRNDVGSIILKEEEKREAKEMKTFRDWSKSKFPV